MEEHLRRERGDGNGESPAEGGRPRSRSAGWRTLAVLAPQWFGGAAGLLLVLLAVYAGGCGRSASEEDLTRARSVVQRVLYSSSYEDFLQGFTQKRRARMEDTAIWIRWWQEKISKDRSIWAIESVRDGGRGTIEVVVQHRRRPTSRQYYRLVREGRTWAIQEIESER